MRIIGGQFKGRRLQQPATDKTRPLSDLAREGLFNVLGDVAGLTVLDAYAGSGAVGLEALSRGAAHVTGVEMAQEAVRTIQENVQQLGAGNRYTLVRQPIDQWLKQTAQADAFHIIYAGPPFGQAEQDTAEQLGDLLTAGGLLIFETPKRGRPLELPALRQVDSRTYGESTLTFYQRPADA